MSDRLVSLESELSRINLEQRTALASLTKLGAKEELVKVRDEVWGDGEIEVVVGIIDMRPKKWGLIQAEQQAAPHLWETVEPSSYDRTLRNKLRGLRTGSSDPETILYGIDPDRYRGWAGVSLAFYYPDITSAQIPSGMYGIDYTRIGPDWRIMREDLTVAAYQEPSREGLTVKVFSKRFTSSFAISEQSNPSDSVSRLLQLESACRIAGAEDINNYDIVNPTRQRLTSMGFKLSPMVLGFGIWTNVFVPPATLLYTGFLEKQMRSVKILCNNPCFIETVEDCSFSEEAYSKRLAGRTPGPSIPYRPNQPLRWLLDTRVLPAER